jgi:hypothetical protein
MVTQYLTNRHYNERHGAIFSDNSLGVGIPFFTTNKDGATNFPNADLFGNPGCIVAGYDGNRDLSEFGHSNPCPDSLNAVCMRKLGTRVITSNPLVQFK